MKILVIKGGGEDRGEIGKKKLETLESGEKMGEEKMTAESYDLACVSFKLLRGLTFFPL